MTRDHAQELLHRLGERLGIGRIELDQDGVAFLTFDERLVMVGYDTAESRLVLMATLGEPPLEPRGLCRLLEANFLWRATGGGSFAIDPGSGLLALLRPLPAQVEASEMQRALASLVRFADGWEAELAAAAEQAAAAPADAPHPAMLRA